ncbi:MAG: methyltransferase regulatory domain-containing protein [Gammaproteobacteria bacterium]|nr:methyltransferase regulatory domain-containing protein [Gammaproteobacteria bacterium]MBI5615174.1 methyltransferase regulatory domain-containing protein [Gammaproteobacteria bacterium]
MNAPTTTTYDSIPYESYPFENTHPAHLASIAGLFGFPAVDPAACRVLELGCGAGGNLIPMADTAPGSRFHGIDTAATQIDKGRETIAALGLTNVTLECGDILAAGRELGEFDYIVCHGVYSWVPEAVQTRILTLCRELLSPHGIAYISYNTYPGWHLRATVREMMNFHARGFDDDRDRIAQARALLNFLVDSVPQGNTYGQMLRDELELVRDRDDAYLFHEHLEICNTPLYFHQFAERAQAAGLGYLGEAALSSMMLTQDISPKVRETLQRIAPDIIRFEQYLDFLRNRTFRRTLLCHAEVALRREITPATIADYRVSSALVPHTPEDGERGSEGLMFRHPGGMVLSAHTALERTLLATLTERSPAALPLTALATLVGEGEDDAAGLSGIASIVLECASNGVLELHRHPDLFTTGPGPRPACSALVRWQLRDQSWATNRRHLRVELPPFDRHLLALLDGSRDREALAREMTALVTAKTLRLLLQDEPVEDPAIVAEIMGPAIDKALARLANAMLLVA